jgi:hypothetical protein
MCLIKILELAFLGYMAHGLADFSLQSDSMARGKNRHRFDPSTVPPGQKTVNRWKYWMSAHALVNGLVFYFVFGSLLVAVLEVITHCVIDILKCENKINIFTDQLLHYGCIWGYVFLMMVI